jgi:hypothetical protein
MRGAGQQDRGRKQQSKSPDHSSTPVKIGLTEKQAIIGAISQATSHGVLQNFERCDQKDTPIGDSCNARETFDETG